MCERCDEVQNAAARVAVGPIHGILATIMFLIAELPRAMADEMQQHPLFMVLAGMDADQANEVFHGRVCTEFCRQHYAMAKSAPDPQFDNIMEAFVETYFAARAAADDEGRTPMEWFASEFQPRIEGMYGEGWDGFKEALETVWQNQVANDPRARRMVNRKFLRDNGIDPD